MVRIYRVKNTQEATMGCTEEICGVGVVVMFEATNVFVMFALDPDRR